MTCVAAETNGCSGGDARYAGLVEADELVAGCPQRTRDLPVSSGSPAPSREESVGACSNLGGPLPAQLFA